MLSKVSEELGFFMQEKNLFRRSYVELIIDEFSINDLDYKSIVPMINLSWGLARNIRVSDALLADYIK